MKRAYWISLGALAGLIAVAVGCGSTPGADGLFGAGVGGSAATTSSVNGSGDTSTSTGGMNASSSSTGSASSSSTGSASSSSTGSASSSSAQSSSSSGGGQTIPCGDQLMCPLGNLSGCCWTDFNNMAKCVQGDPASDGCNTDPVQGGFQTRIDCNGPANCPGATCCGHLNQAAGGQYYNTVSCQPSCNANNLVMLCDPNAPNICPNGLSCQQSSILPPNYFVCK